MVSFLTHPDQSVGEVNWVTDQESQRLLAETNATDAPYPSDKTIHALFEEQVDRTPHHLALIAPNTQLSYQVLNSRANQLAHYLLKHHAMWPDELIAVCLERSQWMLIALLGILKSGAAYVPIDPDYPVNRINFIVHDIDAKVILTTQAQAQHLRCLPNIDWNKTSLLVLDSPDFISTLDTQPIENPLTTVTGSHLAYVMYTSGTTGTPKGIQIEHRGIVNQIHWMNQTYPLRYTDRILQRTPYVFDISVWELFWANWVGATIVFAKPDGHKEPDYLIHLIQQHHVSVIQFTPSMLNEFSHSLGDTNVPLASLRHLFCIGEVLHSSTVHKTYSLLPNVKLHNLYGPTEASINVSFYECADHQPVLIGRPISNTHLYVLDEACRPVTIGAKGELYISGVGLARGYHNQSMLTQQHFISNPFQTNIDKKRGVHERLYKTGDTVRWHKSGNLEFVGRNDTQIKLRGYRIELAEIETVLNQHKSVQQSVVEVIDNRLIAYCVAEHPALSEEAVRTHAALYLPNYMVPYRVIFLKNFPLTVSGKVNKTNLPLPPKLIVQPIVRPNTDIQKNIASVFADVLNIDHASISVTDNFFKLGGDSILAIRLVSRLNTFLPRRIRVKDIYHLKTVEALSAWLNHDELLPTKLETDYEPFSLIDLQHYRNQIDLDKIEDIYPASHLQMGMLLESSLSDQGTYHDVFFYELNLPFDQQKFLSIWEALAKKHALLRARFMYSDEHALGVVVFKKAQLHYEFYVDQSLRQLIDDERLKHFSHTEECLFHLIVNQHADNFEFIFSFHHAIVDGWSIASLINEFIQTYAYGQAISLPSEVRQQLSYGEFVRNEQQRLNDAASLSFWESYLSGSEPAEAEWKFDDIATSPDSLFTSSFFLMQDETALTHKLAHDLSISVDSVFLYAYAKTLSFFLNSDDITVGVVFNNRLEKLGGDALFGLFLNVLPFRVQLNRHGCLQDALSKIFSTKIAIYDHKHIPYAHLKSRFKRDLYKFGFNFVHFHVLEQSGKMITKQGGFDRTSIPFVLEVVQGDRFKVELKAHDHYISQRYLDYFRHYLHLALKNILHDKNELCLDATDYQKMVDEWKGVRKPYPNDKTVHQLFEEQVQRTPDAVALVFEDKTFTYRALNEHANQLAHHLIHQYQIKPDDLIGLCLDTDEWIVISILATMKAGAAYVPMLACYPSERIAHILRDSQAKLVLTSTKHREQVRQCVQNLPCTLFAVDDVLNLHRVRDLPLTNPNTSFRSNNLAYVIYTSGTTGKPNGVMIEHQSVVNLSRDIAERQNLQPNKRVALFSSYVFDAFVHELFPALLSGCKTVLLNDALRYDVQRLSAYFEAQQIQISYIPTILINDFIKVCKSPSIELIYTAGDRLVLDKGIDVDHLGYQLINEYGPTEATVGSTYKRVCQSETGKINANNIGQPLANYICYVCRDDGQLAPIGAIGELCIAGVGLARGYLNNTALTKKKFVPNPFQINEEGHDGVNSVLYKTGDLVRWLPDGDLEFIGRNDSQIKIRGHRVELSEIEHVLTSLPGIQQGRVLPITLRSTESDGKMDASHLVAYYIKDMSAQQIDETDFRRYWQNLYDDTYSQLDQTMYRENLQGWNSSFTGEPIPKIDMLEWRDETLAKIKKLNPTNILEVGSGSGLLLFNLLDQCQHYYASDISKNAVRYTEKVIHQLDLHDKVTALRCEADELPYSKLNNKYDTVILNSVVQYFPNLAYLENVLVQLIDHMQAGSIFIGDIRDLRLLNCFHHAVLHFKKMDSNLNDVEYFAAREKELLIGPQAFINFKKRHSRISSVQIFPKLSKATNEMSRYRYDVILHVDGAGKMMHDVDAYAFAPVLDLASYVMEHSGQHLYIKYPNEKVAQDYFNYQSACHQTCAVSQDLISGLLTLEQIQSIFDEHNYDVAFHLDVYDPLYLNLIAYKKGKPLEIEIIHSPNPTNTTAVANNPLTNMESLEAEFNDQLQSRLSHYLPDHMIPSYFFALEKFPLTVNGKLDVDALPKPIQPPTGDYVLPRNQSEATLCRIFAQVLGLSEENISVKDDFFKIGGNSLLIFKLISKFKTQFDCQIQPCNLFANRTVEKLSEFLTHLLRENDHAEFT